MRLIFDPMVTKADVDHFSEREGWILRDFTPFIEGELFEKIWTTEGQDAVIYYIDDPVVQTRYLVVEGPEEASVADEVRRSLVVATEGEILAGLAPDAAPAVRQRHLFAAGLLANDPGSDALFRPILDALGDENDYVRYAAVIAAGYANRPEALARVRPLAESDPHEAVRSMARSVVTGLERVEREGVL